MIWPYFELKQTQKGQFFVVVVVCLFLFFFMFLFPNFYNISSKTKIGYVQELPNVALNIYIILQSSETANTPV